jgi:hypothetical protein
LILPRRFTYSRLSRLLLTLLLCNFYASVVQAQIGGQRAFEFLHLPFNARTAALGGANISAGYDDINMTLSNPSLLPGVTAGALSFNHQVIAMQAHLSSVAYADTLSRWGGMWGVGVQNLTYGRFEGYDDLGNQEDDFTAGDVAISLLYARKVENFNIGGGLKWAYSHMQAYAQSAILMDLSGSFVHPTQDLVVAMAVCNLGFFTGRIDEAGPINLPFDVKLGASFKPQYMPFRFSITAHRLFEWELVYHDVLQDGDEKPGFVDNTFRHLIFGGELLLNKNVNLRMGYNHLVRREMSLSEYGFLTGFSFGFLIHTQRFSLAYARNIYHVAGGGHTFSLITNINRFIN